MKNPCSHCGYRDFYGAATRIRTGDLILTKDALYRLSYSSISAECLGIIQRIFQFVKSEIQKNVIFSCPHLLFDIL